jgi:hypothetical protein
VARAHQQGGGTGIGQFDEHAAVQPGLAAVDDAAVYELERHSATALAGFIQSQGFALGFDFELCTVQ